MIVEQIWTGNDYRNFNYLIACPETGDAMAIDPVDVEKCLACAAENDWRVTQLLNTHEHGDHIAGNDALREATGATLLAHRDAAGKIAGIDRGLGSGDVVNVGRTVELSVLDTPGHTMSHICLLWRGDSPALFCGDTLFNAGVGNCRGGGNPHSLFESIEKEIAPLADETRIYPGHDYFENNLRFALDREPDNARASQLINELRNSAHPDQPLVSTLGLEREINPFLRLQSRSIVDHLRSTHPTLGANPGRQDVFLALRELRDRW